MHATSPRRTSGKAFTLIELMVVVVMMGIFMTMAVVGMGYGTTADYELNSTARKLAGRMEQAYRYPQTTGTRAELLYDIDNQHVELWLQRKPEADEDLQEYADYDIDDLMELVDITLFGDPENPQRSKVWLTAVQTYDGRRFDSGTVLISFRLSGSSTGHVVFLESNQFNEFQEEPTRVSVEINPLSGVAKVYDFHKAVEEPVRD